MSHRRKSARPTSKLRRAAADTSSDSDVDPPHTKMLLEEQLRVAVSGDDHDQHQLPPSPNPPPQFALPPDLWQDFLALQAATHLDTAALIRRLISQYGRKDSQEDASHKPRSASENGDVTLAGQPASSSSDVMYTHDGPDVCGVSEVAMTPNYMGSLAVGAAAHDDDDDDCIVLDLSSGRAGRDSELVTYTADDVKEEYADDVSSEFPLDLTVSKGKTPPAPTFTDVSNFLINPATHSLLTTDNLQQPIAVDASSLLLSSLAHSVLRNAVSVPALSSTVQTRSGTAPAPSAVSASSLFNLSGLPMIGEQARQSSALHEQIMQSAIHEQIRHNAVHEKVRQSASASSSPAGLDKTKLVPSAILGGSPKARSPATISSSGSSSFQQNVLPHFLSLPAGQTPVQQHADVPGQDVQLPLLNDAAVYGALNAELLKQLTLAAGLPVLSAGTSVGGGAALAQPQPQTCSSSWLHAAQQLLGATVTSDITASSSASPASMKLPTVTSLDFPTDVTEVGARMTSPAVTSMPASAAASAFLLDVSSGSLQVTGVGGMSTVNFPIMTTAGGGGLVAIPVLQALPEAFAAAAAAAAASHQKQQQQASNSSTATTMTAATTTVTPSSAAHLYLHQRQQQAASPSGAGLDHLPPPPPYSAAVAATSSLTSSSLTSSSMTSSNQQTQPSTTRGLSYTSVSEVATSNKQQQQPSKPPPKAPGRPRGQTKSKAQPKNMMLLTENTLFPGVYTSILKLPWSRRSRGKSSAKIKDVIPTTITTTTHHEGGGGGEEVMHGGCPNVTVVPIVQCEPGEAERIVQQYYEQQQQQQLQQQLLEQQKLKRDAKTLTVPKSTVVDCTMSQTAVCSSSATPSSSSPMMIVYQNAVFSDGGGKPVRKRGRPPKLPVLSQLLTEKTPHHHRPIGGEETSSTSLNSSSFSLPLLGNSSEAHRHAPGVLAADLTASSAVAALAASVKQEPLDADETHCQPSKLFTGIHIVHNARKRDAPYSEVKTEPDEQEDYPHPHKQIKMEEPASDPGLDGDQESELKIAPKGGELFWKPASKGQGAGQQEEVESLETRFDMLANQLSLEISTSNAYMQSMQHANSQSTTVKNLKSGTSSASSAQQADGPPKQWTFSSKSMVEIKPSRRVLNNLIKPSDDCVYTSFRIRPRNCGRRGGRRGGRRNRQSAAKRQEEEEATPSLHGPDLFEPAVAYGIKEKDYEDYLRREMLGKELLGGGATTTLGEVVGRVASGSAVITERIPGGGELPQRLYRDLFSCKQCGEMLPADSNTAHHCRIVEATVGSPPLRSCDSCGTMYLGNHYEDEEESSQNLCEDCSSKQGVANLHNSAHAKTDFNSASSPLSGEGFACQPCGVSFVNIADYIQHRRSAHLDKIARRSHTLRTLPCPARACPRLFHMQAELRKHVVLDHPGELLQAEYEDSEDGGGGDAATTDSMHNPASAPQDSFLSFQRDIAMNAEPDVHANSGVVDAVHDVYNAEAGVENESSQLPVSYPCPLNDCQEQPFPTPLDVLEHMQHAHEGLSQWPCPMPNCARMFGAERHLRVHVLMHKDEKPMKCPFCSYRCRQKNALAWHVRRHPEAAGQYRKLADLAAGADA